MLNTNQQQKEFETRVIQSRIGEEIEINPANAILFPNGIPGFPDATKFCLVQPQTEKFNKFLYMQSTQNDEFGFLLLPLDLSNQQIISEEDIALGCEQCSIERKNLAMLLIISTVKNESGTFFSVNAKAPIFLDCAKKVARQYIFQNSSYETNLLI